MGKPNKSEALRRRIIEHLRTEWRADYEGSSWVSFAALAEELGAPLGSVKREVRRLARAGVLRYTWLWSDDRGVCGGGYVLTARSEQEDTETLARMALTEAEGRRP